MRLVVTEQAEKDLLEIDPKNRQRIQEGIERMLSYPRSADLKKIKAHENRWRLRVGDWRVILRIDREIRVVYVLHVRHRKEAYR